MNVIIRPVSPFVVGNMITDPNKFWGRKKESQEIFARLQKMESTSIVGERRIGKSSLAYYLYKIGQQSFLDYEFVWLDGQSNHSTSPDSFFHAIKKQSSIGYSSGADQTKCLINFEDAVNDHNKKFVLIINEFELLTSQDHYKEFNPTFFNTLRLLAEQSGKCTLLTTSAKPLKDLCKHVLGISSPFYNIFVEINLTYFTNEEANAFLEYNHDGTLLTLAERKFIQKDVKNYQHPLILQIACDQVYKNRDDKRSDQEIIKCIEDQANHFLNHRNVQEARVMVTSNKNQQKQQNKVLDLIVSILIPVLGICLLMLEYAILIRYLSDFQAVLVGIFTAIVGFAVLVFAGRSIDIIGESTFYKLFARLVNQIPVFSTLLNNVRNLFSKK